MKDKDKLDAIKYICENILGDDNIIYHRTFTVMILQSILEVINDREHIND